MNRKLFITFLIVAALFTIAAVPVMQNFGAIRASTVRITGSTGLQMEGNKIDFDTDRDTSITADTDDQVDIEIGGTDLVQIDSTGVDIASGDLIVTAGGFNLNPQDVTVAAGFSISTTTTGLVSMTSSAEVTSSTTTGIITSTATSGDVIILSNNNASDAINIDGTGGTVECKADVALGAGDTLTLWYNGDDSAWNCLAGYDNS